MNCACHRIIEVVVRHGCTEIISALKVHSELAFVASITRMILTKDMISGMRDQIFLFFW